MLRQDTEERPRVWGPHRLTLQSDSWSVYKLIVWTHTRHSKQLIHRLFISTKFHKQQVFISSCLKWKAALQTDGPRNGLQNTEALWEYCLSSRKDKQLKPADKCFQQYYSGIRLGCAYSGKAAADDEKQQQRVLVAALDKCSDLSAEQRRSQKVGGHVRRHVWSQILI